MSSEKIITDLDVYCELCKKRFACIITNSGLFVCEECNRLYISDDPKNEFSNKSLESKLKQYTKTITGLLIIILLFTGFCGSILFLQYGITNTIRGNLPENGRCLTEFFYNYTLDGDDFLQIINTKSVYMIIESDFTTIEIYTVSIDYGEKITVVNTTLILLLKKNYYKNTDFIFLDITFQNSSIFLDPFEITEQFQKLNSSMGTIEVFDLISGTLYFDNKDYFYTFSLNDPFQEIQFIIVGT